MSLQAASLREQLARLRPRRLLPLLLVALGCTLVLSLLGFGRLHAQFGELAMRDAQVYKAQIDRFDALLAMVLDAETGVRGYLLNDHKPVYLDAYTESQRAIEPLLARIEADYPPGSADRPEFETLARLVRLKLALLADTVTAGRVISAGPPGQGGAGKAYMDQIRQSIKVLRDHLEARNQTLVNESIKRFREMEHAVTGLALGALGLIIALFGVQQRQATLRARLATLLERENVALESMVSQRTRELSDLASYLTDAREAERARLARELHDELGALLTAAKMDASWLLRSLGATAGPDIQARFRRLIDTIGSGITIKRRIIDDLRPPLLQGLGLVEALRALTDELHGEYQLALQLPASEPPCSEEQSLALFRIVQESLTNTRKYAHARHIEVGLALVDNMLHLWVGDDGVGFDPDSPQLSRHGLAGMQHRTQMFEGHFEVRSAPGQGTRIDARMPLRRPAASGDHQPVA